MMPMKRRPLARLVREEIWRQNATRQLTGGRWVHALGSKANIEAIGFAMLIAWRISQSRARICRLARHFGELLRRPS